MSATPRRSARLAQKAADDALYEIKWKEAIARWGKEPLGFEIREDLWMPVYPLEFLTKKWLESNK